MKTKTNKEREKSMKKIKKILALALAMAMVLGMTMTTFAAETPKETDQKSVTITGLKATTSFKAYRFIKPVYNSNGLTGYVWAANTGNNSGNEVTITNNQIDGLTTDLVTDLSNNTEFLEAAKATADADEGLVDYFEFDSKIPSSDGEVTIDLNAGMWIVIPTDAGDKPTVVYNPMLIGVYYGDNDSDKMNVGAVDASGSWTLYSSDAFAKSTDMSEEGGKPEKTVEDSATGEVGTEKKFTLSGIIPSYSDEYFEFDENGEVVEDSATRKVVYTLKDSCASGLEYTGALTVTVGAKEVAGDNYTVTYYDASGAEIENSTDLAAAKSFSVTLKPAYIHTLQTAVEADARKIAVKYTAEITSDAVKEAAKNTFVLEYTRVPGVDENSRTTTDPSDVYTYTASINGLVKKIGEGEKANGLDGATFTLYRTYNGGKLSGEFGSVITGDDFQVKFAGLEFGKTYYMQETGAPTGYSINDTVYAVTCSYPSDVNADKLKAGEIDLTKYVVKIEKFTNLTEGEAAVKEFTVNYKGDVRTLVEAPVVIQNTQMATLPSTGGIGTTIFTIGGCAIMILAAALYFISRRKAAK